MQKQPLRKGQINLSDNVKHVSASPRESGAGAQMAVFSPTVVRLLSVKP